jgi:hypothetical protein
MDKERVLKLAAHIRTPQVKRHFNINNWLRAEVPVSGPDIQKGVNWSKGVTIGEVANECGTVMCGAGHCVALFRPKFKLQVMPSGRVLAGDIPDMAEELLDLTEEQADALFKPRLDMWSLVTPQVFADTLEHLAETGEVVWQVKLGMDHGTV